MFLFILLNACGIYTVDKSVHSYEWFHDVFQEVQARQTQVQATTELIASEVDPGEVRRLKVERAGQQQSCRDLVAEYNSNSDKVTTGIFQGSSLPDHLDAEICEVK